MSHSPVLFEGFEEDDEMSLTAWRSLEMIDVEDTPMDTLSDNPGADSQVSFHVLKPLSPGSSRMSFVSETPPPPLSLLASQQPSQDIHLPGLASCFNSSSQMETSQVVGRRPQKSRKQTSQHQYPMRPSKKIKVEGYNCKLNGGTYIVVARDLDVLEAIEKALTAVKQKAHQRNLSSSTIRALTLQLNQVETIISILQDVPLPLGMSCEAWDEMFTVSKTMFASTQDDIERVRKETFDIGSSTDDLSTFFSQNLTISTVSAASRSCRRVKSHPEVSIITEVPSSREAGQTRNREPSGQRPIRKSQVSASRPASVPTTPQNEQQAPSVVRRGRPPGAKNKNVKGTKTAAERTSSVPTDSQQSSKPRDDQEEDEDIICSSQIIDGNTPTALRVYGNRSRGPSRSPRLGGRLNNSNIQDQSRCTTRSHRLQSSSIPEGAGNHHPLNGPPELPSNDVNPPEKEPHSLPNVPVVNPRRIDPPPSQTDVDPVEKSAPLNRSTALDDILELDSSQLIEVGAEETVNSTMNEDNSQVVRESVQEQPLSQQSPTTPPSTQQPLTQPNHRKTPVPSSSSDKLARLTEMARYSFSLRPHVVSGTLAPGKNNLKMSFKGRVYMGSLKMDGSIEMNGFSFENIASWIKSVSGMRYTSHRVQDKATLKLLYDGRPLEELILPDPPAKNAAQPKRRYNEIPFVTRASTPAKKQPVAVSAPNTQEPTMPLPVEPPPSPAVSVPFEPVYISGTIEPEPEPEFVPDEMCVIIRKIRVPAKAEYFPVCESDELYWNGSKPFPQHLLADLDDWD